MQSKFYAKLGIHLSTPVFYIFILTLSWAGPRPVFSAHKDFYPTNKISSLCYTLFEKC